jgi:3-hydroxyacyl-[acyl-carrier-protein] dehydratase
MPGVLLTEAMAQTSGWLIIGVTNFTRGSGYAITKANIEVDGKTVADAEITSRVMAFPDPKFRTSMGEVAKRIGFPLEDAAYV